MLMSTYSRRYSPPKSHYFVRPSRLKKRESRSEWPQLDFSVGVQVFFLLGSRLVRSEALSRSTADFPFHNGFILIRLMSKIHGRYMARHSYSVWLMQAAGSCRCKVHHVCRLGDTTTVIDTTEADPCYPSQALFPHLFYRSKV